MLNKIIFAIVILTATMGLYSCNDSSSQNESSNTNQQNAQVNNLPTIPSVVCDPFNPPNGSADEHSGLIGSLKYLSDSMPRYGSVIDYLANGVSVPTTIWMSQVNVPPQNFDRGFIGGNGQALTSNEGYTLFQYFSLSFTSDLKKPAGAASSYFQIALLSDDGAILQANKGSGFETLINNDGAHISRMKCATSTVELASADSRIPIRLDYFQGPATELALMLFWREVSGPGADLSDPLCDAEGRTLFFDPSTSTPTQAYEDFLGRGWSVIPTDSFVTENPCL